MAGSLLMLKDFQVYGTEYFNPILNVYGYQSNLVIINEMQLFLDNWISQILPSIIGVQQNFMFHYELQLLKLNTTEFVARTLSTDNQGQRSGSIPDRFTAWGFRYNRAILGQRSGSKRIGFVSENDYTGAAPTSTASSLLNTLAGKLASPVKIGIDDTWFPVIIKRPPNPSGTYTKGDISGVVFTEVTTQNSRKR